MSLAPNQTFIPQCLQQMNEEAKTENVVKAAKIKRVAVGRTTQELETNSVRQMLNENNDRNGGPYKERWHMLQH